MFTSPPYFAAETYSDEPTQSSVKFPTYDRWRGGFLHRTLETAVELLKPGGYLAWNIADTYIDGQLCPLERDSVMILQELGMHYETTWKMLLASAPGSPESRGEGLESPYKNHCVVGGRNRRFEPIFVFRKP